MTRAAAILRVLARADEPRGVQAIARELGLIPSTCLHILRALAAEDLVAVDPATKRYRLGAGLLSLARGFLAKCGFAASAQPVLQDLSTRFGVTAIGLEVRGLEHLLVLAISRAHEPFHIHVDLGSRFPALISASGRVIAAFGGYPEPALRAAFARARWDRAPSYTDWRRQVAQTREAGYGVDIDQYILGVTVVSAPVLTEGRVTHALVTVGLSERIKDRVADLGPELIRQAGEVVRRMGG